MNAPFRPERRVDLEICILKQAPVPARSVMCGYLFWRVGGCKKEGNAIQIPRIKQHLRFSFI